MTSVVSIVEGDGETAALPVLLRRLATWLTPEVPVDVLTPIRVYKDRFLNRPEEFSRHLQLAAKKCGDDGWVLILLDADDDCPAARGAEIVSNAREVIPHRRIAVVLAKREYEAWFIASSNSLDGYRGFASRPSDTNVDAETPRDAKGWLKERMASRSYGETTDQPAFSAQFDLVRARERSRSFRKLCDEWSRNTR
ncbi:MAG: DUF4276 family protein [Desulfovibrionaceae bacterium]|nr:DUF4276 family protein [Desulfovibrionaceae bacterium]